jgi:hypothetical protein
MEDGIEEANSSAEAHHATSIVRGSGPLKIEDGIEDANSSADANLQSRTASHQKVNCLHKVFFYNEKCCF